MTSAVGALPRPATPERLSGNAPRRKAVRQVGNGVPMALEKTRNASRVASTPAAFCCHAEDWHDGTSGIDAAPIPRDVPMVNETEVEMSSRRPCQALERSQIGRIISMPGHGQMQEVHR